MSKKIALSYLEVICDRNMQFQLNGDDECEEVNMA